MDNHTATELAYQNGYEQGKKDAVRHGRWLKVEDHWLRGKGFYLCNRCKSRNGLQISFNYCPNCGCKMDG